MTTVRLIMLTDVNGFELYVAVAKGIDDLPRFVVTNCHGNTLLKIDLNTTDFRWRQHVAQTLYEKWDVEFQTTAGILALLVP